MQFEVILKNNIKPYKPCVSYIITNNIAIAPYGRDFGGADGRWC